MGVTTSSNVADAYTPIATNTVSGTSTLSVTFSSFSGYTDLRLVSVIGVNANDYTIGLRFNGDTGTNYSGTEFLGNGSTASSNRATNTTNGFICNNVTPSTTVGQAVYITDIMNYANTTTYKTAISRENSAAAPNYPGSGAVVSLWRNTAAITSLTVFISSSYFLAGSTFTLYGIKAA